MHVYGHRGAAGEAPENTIAGCLHAIERGVRHVEIDLRLSADGQLVIIHDKTLDRTTGRQGKPGSYRASELAAMDARAYGTPWPRKKDCGVPTLDAFLKATGKIKCYQLEVKPDTRTALRQVSRLLAEKFATRVSATGVVVTSSSNFLHQYLGEIAPHITRGLVISSPDAISHLEELGCEYSAMHWSTCSPRVVKKLKRRGIHVSVWTVNDAQMIRRLHKMQVDSVITDYPSMALPLVAALERQKGIS